MIKLKIGLLPLLLVILVTSAVYGGDSLKVHSFNSFQTRDFLNPWSETGNITGMIYNLPGNVSDFNYGLDHGKGDFHRIMEASEYQSHTLSTKSYIILNGYHLYGNFTYNKKWEMGSRWNGTYNPYRGNPYILGDSVSGVKYRKECYELAGAIAKTLNKSISLGCKISYLVGVGAKQKDPRPENTLVQFIVNPGIILHKEHYNLGVDLGYSNRKEEIEYKQTVVDNSDISYFAFKGFGFYYKAIENDYFRFQNEKALFGSIQAETKKRRITSMSEIKFKYSKEIIEDSKSAIIKERGGDWDVFDTGIKEAISFTKNNLHHKISFSVNYFNGDGTEFTQQKIYGGSIVEYVTIATNLKFNRTTINGQLQYDLQKFFAAEKLNWSFHSGVGSVVNNETYYYTPEVFTSAYTNVVGTTGFEKNFYLKGVHLAPMLDASYIYNISNELNLSNQTEITKKQNKELYISDFNYYKANLLKLEGQLRAGFDARKIKNIDQLFVSLNYGFFKSSNADSSLTVISGKVGFMF